jgi:quinol monooxygenase YgiN
LFSQFTLQDLGSLGEFVGALGVVISLVYLAQQMRQNTTSVRAASFNSMTENSIRILEHSIRDGDFAEFLHRAQLDPSALSANEFLRWDAYMTAVYRHFGNLVYQYRVGVLDKQMWESYRNTLKKHLRTPSWRAWFEDNKATFSSSLVELVARVTRELDTEEPL